MLRVEARRDTCGQLDREWRWIVPTGHEHLAHAAAGRGSIDAPGEDELLAVDVEAHLGRHAGDAARVGASQNVDQITLLGAAGVDDAEGVVGGKVRPHGAADQPPILLGQRVAQEELRSVQEAAVGVGVAAVLADEQRSAEADRLGRGELVVGGDGAGVAVVFELRQSVRLRVQMRA